jgi:hypothetical protein
MLVFEEKAKTAALGPQE